MGKYYIEKSDMNENLCWNQLVKVKSYILIILYNDYIINYIS